MTTTSAQYASDRASKYSRLIGKLAKMTAEQIKSELATMHDKAHALPKRMAWEAEQLHKMANGAANHYFLILNPEMAHGENLAHAISRGLPIPQI